MILLQNICSNQCLDGKEYGEDGHIDFAEKSIATLAVSIGTLLEPQIQLIT